MEQTEPTHDERIHDAATGCEISGSIGADDTAVVEEAVDPGAADAERALAGTGVVGGGTEGSGGVTFVYCIRAVGHDMVKIGITGNLQKRLTGLKTGCPFDLEVIGFMKLDSRKQASFLESILHAQFGGSRTNGEWFNYSGGIDGIIG